MVIGVGTRHSTTSSRVGCSGDRIAVQLEVGYIAGFSCYHKAVVGIGGNLCPILGPFHEMVTRGGYCGQVTGFSIIEGARASHGTAIGRVDRHHRRDIVAVQLEVGYIAVFSCYHKAVVGIGGNLCPILGPFHEMVTRGGYCGQVTGFSIIEGARASHGTAIGRVDRHHRRDIVAVQLEVGYIAVFSCYHKAVVGIGGNLCPILGPFHEVVACGGYCGQVTGFSITVGARTSHRTAIGRVDRHHRRDVIAIDRVGHRHRHVIVWHCACHRGDIWCVAFHCR